MFDLCPRTSGFGQSLLWVQLTAGGTLRMKVLFMVLTPCVHGHIF